MNVRRLGRIALLSVALISLTVLAVIAAQQFTAFAFNDTAPLNAPLQVGFSVGVEQVVSGFNQPLYVTHAGDGSGRLFVVEKAGRIMIVRDGQLMARPFLDITDRVGSRAYEQGLLGLAFDPEYRNNRRFYVDYTDQNGDTVIARFQADAGDPNLADADSEQVILSVPQPFPNHNGGMIAYGPDKYLYVGLGDGGSAGDPMGHGQDRFNLLGKILRLDVRGSEGYTIPPDNPFADGGQGLPEVWSYGWRNPWRFSFDRATNDLYVGDVGQGSYEEISLERAGSGGGQNYGWNVMEGNHCFQPQNGCAQDGLVLPIAEYSHELGISVTGGYVYRGTAYPRMQGTYFYGDFGSTRLWAARETEPGAWRTSEVLVTGFPISSFGEDEAGELYVVDFGGSLYRLVDTGN